MNTEILDQFIPSRMQDRARYCVRLHFVEGKLPVVAAREAGMSKQEGHRAINKVRQNLEQAGYRMVVDYRQN